MRIVWSKFGIGGPKQLFFVTFFDIFANQNIVNRSRSVFDSLQQAETTFFDIET